MRVRPESLDGRIAHFMMTIILLLHIATQHVSHVMEMNAYIGI